MKKEYLRLIESLKSNQETLLCYNDFLSDQWFIPSLRGIIKSGEFDMTAKNFESHLPLLLLFISEMNITFVFSSMQASITVCYMGQIKGVYSTLNLRPDQILTYSIEKSWLVCNELIVENLKLDKDIDKLIAKSCKHDPMDRDVDQNGDPRCTICEKSFILGLNRWI